MAKNRKIIRNYEEEDTSAPDISVNCYLCRDMFHAINCPSKLITTPTFLEQFNDAAGNNTASRPGMFCYIYGNLPNFAEPKSSLETKVDLLESRCSLPVIDGVIQKVS